MYLGEPSNQTRQDSTFQLKHGSYKSYPAGGRLGLWTRQTRRRDHMVISYVRIIGIGACSQPASQPKITCMLYIMHAGMSYI